MRADRAGAVSRPELTRREARRSGLARSAATAEAGVGREGQPAADACLDRRGALGRVRTDGPAEHLLGRGRPDAGRLRSGCRKASRPRRGARTGGAAGHRCLGICGPGRSLGPSLRRCRASLRCEDPPRRLLDGVHWCGRRRDDGRLRLGCGDRLWCDRLGGDHRLGSTTGSGSGPAATAATTAAADGLTTAPARPRR